MKTPSLAFQEGRLCYMRRYKSLASLIEIVQKFLPSLIIMGLRGLSLGIKFILMILMGRYLELSAIGIYGLLVGVSLIYSQMAGWGFGFNLSRVMVTTEGEERQVLLAHQWGIFLYTYLLTGVALAAFVLSPWGQSEAVKAVTSWMAVVIILSEHASVEQSRLLISTKHAIKGNILLFIRTAGWAIPISFALVLMPQFRTVDAVLWAWAAGGGLSVLLGAWWSRTYIVSWRNFIRDLVYVPFSWLRDHTKTSVIVYTAFSISVVMTYLNRFSTSIFSSLDETGLYTLYWSIINAIHVLGSTGFIQTAYPDMIECRADSVAFHQKVVALYKQAIVFSIICSLAIAGSAPWLFPLMHKAAAVDALPIFYVMLLGGVVKLLATVSFYVLYARHNDKSLMNGMFVALAASLPVSFLFVYAFGLWGAAISDCVYALVLLVVLMKIYAREKISASRGLLFTDEVEDASR